MSPDVHAKVRTLAKYNRRSYSAICNDLIIYALKQERYRDLLDEAEQEGVKMKPVEDPRTRINQPMTMDMDDSTNKVSLSGKPYTEHQIAFFNYCKNEEKRIGRRLTREEFDEVKKAYTKLASILNKPTEEGSEEDKELSREELDMMSQGEVVMTNSKRKEGKSFTETMMEKVEDNKKKEEDKLSDAQLKQIAEYLSKIKGETNVTTK